jgi:hypothetical protein
MVAPRVETRNAEHLPILKYLQAKLGDSDGHFPEFQYHCPFCAERRGTESANKKLRVNVVKKKAVCFRCGYAAASLQPFLTALAGGSLTNVEAELLSTEFTPVEPMRLHSEVLMKFYATDFLRDIERAAPLKPVLLPSECQLLATSNDVLCKRGLNYLLKKRGITLEKVKKHKLGFCPTGEYAQRIIFPVFMFGRQVYFTNRTVGDHPAKSKNPPNRDGYYSATKVLLNFDGVVGAERIEIVEGPIDMMAPPNAVATLGKRLHDDQIKLLEYLISKGTREIVIARDADADCWTDYCRLAGRWDGVKVSCMLLDRGDPDSRRDELDTFLQQRRVPTLLDRVRQQFQHSK